ncbi:hypothetical protein [Agrilactobacillus composti]|uniref:hypothetical protein n=1 Tax=Agrilactobacillus composti TaxID=398555 RepID=UPI000551EBB6|nr:hypothetical protein [Agrilactobacillus composti]
MSNESSNEEPSTEPSTEPNKEPNKDENDAIAAMIIFGLIILSMLIFPRFYIMFIWATLESYVRPFTWVISLIILGFIFRKE